MYTNCGVALLLLYAVASAIIMLSRGNRGYGIPPRADRIADCSRDPQERRADAQGNPQGTVDATRGEIAGFAPALRAVRN